MDTQELSFESLREGEAVAAVNAAIETVLDNIADVETDPEKVRKLTVAITFKPSKDRKAAALAVSIDTKLAGRRGTTAIIGIGVDSEGRTVAEEYGKRQMDWTNQGLEATPIRGVDGGGQ